jgi:hypothetical protein
VGRDKEKPKESRKKGGESGEKGEKGERGDKGGTKKGHLASSSGDKAYKSEFWKLTLPSIAKCFKRGKLPKK